MNYLITGAGGFIGSKVLKKALLENNIVYGSTRKNVDISSKNLKNNLIWIPKPFYEITDNELKKIDIIINCAAAGVSPQKVSKEKMYEINVEKTFEFFKKAINSGIKVFISIGTCLEYGYGGNIYNRIPTYAKLEPISDYAKTKTLIFKKMYQYSKINKIKFLHIRLFNVYGIGQNESNFWPSLLKAAKDGKDFEIKKSKYIRDFIKVDDAAKFIIDQSRNSIFKTGYPLVINYGSGKGLTLLDFAKNEWIRLKAKGKIINHSFTSDDKEVIRIVSDNTIY